MRISIIGNSGSGKSTLAARLAQTYGLPLLELDAVVWELGKIGVQRDMDLAAADVAAFCSANAQWVVEGCYASLTRASLPFRPQLVFLDPGVERCTLHCRSRPWERHKYASKEEQDKYLDFLLNWVSEYYTREGDMSHREHLALYEGYAGPKQRLTEPVEEIDRLIRSAAVE